MDCMIRFAYCVFSLLLLSISVIWAVPPVLNYAGQVAVNGQAFDGEGLLKFALVNPDGNVTHWSQDGTSVSGSEPGEHVSVQVRGGLYSILLGNTSIPGMDAMNPSLFQQISDLHLRVWFSDGVNGFERISPDRPFASVPYAMSADIGPGTITSTQLNEQILKYLRPEVVRSPKLPQNREQVYTGQSVTLSADADGKYLTYQWLRNGQEISGATNKEFTISDANATLHNGNYSVRISNDFGHVSTTSVQLDVNDTQLIHEVDLNSSVALEMIWVEPGTFTMGQDRKWRTPEHMRSP